MLRLSLVCSILVSVLFGCAEGPISNSPSAPQLDTSNTSDAPELSTDLVETADDVATEPDVQPETTPPIEPLNLNLNNAQDNLYAFTKMRGSLDPEQEVVFYWTGSIFLAEKAAPTGPAVSEFPGPILRFEGFNIARFVPTNDGVRMISREIAVYQNQYGQIIDCWNNAPISTGAPQNVPVIHVHNDPVNHTVYGGTPHEMGDQVVWTLEVMLRYPNPLPVNQYPLFSASNTYETAELFNFYSMKNDLNDPTQDSVPVHISWSRVGQPVPWMKAGITDTKLIYHTYGRKLLGGFDELPMNLQEYVINNAPEYMTAPQWDESPNVTSWKYVKKLIDTGKYPASCQ